MHATARALVAPGKGILAADESTGTIKKRFDSIGVESTEDARRRVSPDAVHDPRARRAHQRRDPVRRDDPAGDRRRRPVRQGARDAPASIPGIKVDTGAKPLALFPGETVTEGLDGLRERLAEYRELGARFAKWRATIIIGDGHPDRASRSHANAPRDGALRGAVPGGRHRADRRARDPDGRRPRHRRVRGGDRADARRAVRADGRTTASTCPAPC